MKKMLSGIIAFLLIFTSCTPFVYASNSEYEISSGVLSASFSKVMDFEDFRNFKITKGNSEDFVEVFIDGKSVLTDSDNLSELTLDLTEFITYIGEHNFKISETGICDYDLEYSAIVTKNIYGDGFSEDYEDYDIDDANAIKILDKKSMTIRENEGYAKIGEIDSEHGHSLIFGAENLSAAKIPFVGNKTTDSSGVFEYKYDLYLEDISNQMEMTMRYNKSSGTVGINPMYYTKDGNIRLYNGSSWSVVYKVESKKWYSFKFILDYDNLKYDLYINGESIAKDNDLNMADFAKMNDQMRVGINVAAGKSAYAAWDNYVYRSITSQPYIVNVNNGKALNANENSFDAELSSPYADIDKSDISLTADGREIDIDSVTQYGNMLTINTIYPMSGGRKYSLTVKKGTEISSGIYSDIDSVYNFDVNASDDELSDVSLTENNGKYIFRAKSSKNVNAYIIAKDSKKDI